MFNKKIAIGAMICALTFSGCSTEDLLGEWKDAPVSGDDDSPAEVIRMPDGFGSLAAKCHGANMVYSSKVADDGRSRAIAVAANDPECVEKLDSGFIND